jgi:ABC-2 type transport system permease protein
MKAILHHLAYELASGFRDRARLLMLYLFPLAYAALMGGLMGKLNPLFIERMIPALAVFSIMCGTFLSLPGRVVEERNAGIYRSYKINAVPRGAIVLVPVLALLVHEAIATLLIGLLSYLAFKAPLPADWPSFAAAWLLTLGAFSGLGWLIGTFAGSEAAAMLSAQVLFVPSIMLGGLTMPESILPETMKRLARAFPATYAMDGFLGSDANLSSLFILGGLCLFGLSASVLLFRWERRAAKARH